MNLNLTLRESTLVASGRALEVAGRLRDLALAYPGLTLRDFLRSATQDGRIRSWSVCKPPPAELKEPW